MFCPNCGKEHFGDSFCAGCGYALSGNAAVSQGASAPLQSAFVSGDLVAATCPSCGAGIRIDEKADRTICPACNSQILTAAAIAFSKVQVEGEVSVSGIAGVENLLARARSFERDGEIDRAIRYYERVLDVDFDNFEAREGVDRLSKTITDYNLKIEFPKGVLTAYAIIKIDGKKEGTIRPGQYMCFKLPVGAHKVSASSALVGAKEFPVVIESRSSRYRGRVRNTWGTGTAFEIKPTSSKLL